MKKFWTVLAVVAMVGGLWAWASPVAGQAAAGSAAATTATVTATAPADSSAKAAPPRVRRVLAVGNSFTINATKYLDQIVKADGRFELLLTKASIGGSGFEVHLKHAQANEDDPAAGKPYGGKSLKELLTSQPWDIVTVQQNSFASDDIKTYRPHVGKLVEFIRRHAPRAEVWMHETWAYRADDPVKFSAKYTHEQMYTNLRQAYHEVAAELGIRDILPVGDAFWNAGRRPDWQFRYPDPKFDYTAATYPNLPNQDHSLNIGWYWKKEKDGSRNLAQDTHHANTAGEYLGGLVWFERLFGASAVGNSYLPPGVTAADAKILQQAAHETVADSRNNHPQAKGENRPAAKQPAEKPAPAAAPAK